MKKKDKAKKKSDLHIFAKNYTNAKILFALNNDIGGFYDTHEQSTPANHENEREMDHFQGNRSGQVMSQIKSVP